MNSPSPVSPDPRPARRSGRGRRLVNVLVALVVIVVAAAAFVFSYDGVHAFALLGGMSAQLARFYPALFDAVLVIACVAAVVLHDGRWWARLWAWVVAIVLLAAIGTTDVLHATGITLRHRPTEGVVAGAPVVAVLLAFTLLLAVLRQSRGAAADGAGDEPAHIAVPAGHEVAALSAAEPATVALPAAPATASPALPVPGTVHATPLPEAATAGALPAAPAVDRDGPPESPIALPAAAQPGPVPAYRDDSADPDTAVHDQPGEEGHPADAVPATPPDGLPVMRWGAPRAEPDTVAVPAVEPEGEAAGAGETRPAAAPPGIRYAPGRTGRPLVAEPGPELQAAPVPSGANGDEYGAADDTRQYAGLVYTAGAEEAGQPGSGEPGAAEGEDTHPFAGGLFAPASRLNRVRSMPVPPGDDG